MSYYLSALDHPNGTPKHVWIGKAGEVGGKWIGIIRFASGMKPDLQVREHLARSMGSDAAKRLKVVVGTDKMWQSYDCYSRPATLLPGEK